MASVIQRGIRKIRSESLRRTARFRNAATVGVIGCGGISGRHIGSYEEIGISRVVAVADVSPAALAKALDRSSSVRAYRNYEQMLAEVKPHIVSVCTWPQLHAKMVCDAARRGVRGIMCEKPIALRMDEIKDMVAVCEAHGVKLAVGHQYRFHPIFASAAEIVRSGKLGKIQHVYGAIRGSIANNGPHLIDTVRYVLGDPAAERVTCHCTREHDTVERGLPCEESATSRIEFSGGILCQLETGVADQSAFTIRIEGSAGVLEVTPDSLTTNGQRRSFPRKESADRGRLRQFREFVQWVKGKRPDYGCDHRPAAAAAELVLALYESVRTGEPVCLPLQTTGDVIGQLYPLTAEAPVGAVSQRKPAGFAPTLNGSTSARLAMDGGRRAVHKWFVNEPSVGVAELRNLTQVIVSKKMNCKGGRMVRRFEQEFAKRYGSHAAVASTSGTSAIHVALGTVDPDPCDEVVTTPLSDMGTVIPILACNCIPVFADVDPNTGTLTAETIARKITPRTKAVIVVHLFGRPADMGPIVDLCRQREIALIEDCAQAHWAEYHGKKVGTFGDLGCFSLQQSKQITCGDGGITLVNRPELAERAQLFVDKGWARGEGTRAHRFLGMNYRMTELQGAVALAQLQKLPGLVQARRTAALHLVELLSRIDGVVPPPVQPGIVSSWWKFAFSIDEARFETTIQETCEALCVEGVKASLGYLPRPLFEEEMIRCLRTYGKSRYPYSAVDYTAPRASDYPGLSDFNRRWMLLPWASSVRPSHVRSIAEAVTKVMPALVKARHADRTETVPVAHIG